MGSFIKQRLWRHWFGVSSLACILAFGTAEGAQIFVSPPGTYQAIEAAKAGDEVIIAPGTYRFRVRLDMIGTASAPVIVRGADPNNPPVFDYSGQELQTWPGSVSGATAEGLRGAWYITGQYIVVQDIEVTGAFNNGGVLSSAGFRFFVPPTNRGVRLRSHQNQIGVELGAAVLEDSVLTDNATSVAHYFGAATIRNTVFSRAIRHVYSGASSLTLESCWFEPPDDYIFDIDYCGYLCGGTSNAQTVPRTVILSGNVFRVASPITSSWVLLFDGRKGPSSDDGTGTVLSTDVYLVHNTFIHTDPATFAGSHVVQAQGTATTYRIFTYGNVTDGFADAYVSTGSATFADGGGNWTTNTTTSRFPSTQSGVSPLWIDAGALDFHPSTSSPLVGIAPSPSSYSVAPPSLSPTLTPLNGRTARSTWLASGAFELPMDTGSSDAGARDGGSSNLGPFAPRYLRVACGCNDAGGSALSIAIIGLLGVVMIRRRHC